MVFGQGSAGPGIIHIGSASTAASDEEEIAALIDRHSDGHAACLGRYDVPTAAGAQVSSIHRSIAEGTGEEGAPPPDGDTFRPVPIGKRDDPWKRSRGRRQGRRHQDEKQY